MKLLGLYFSGTGNTKFCVEEYVKGLDSDYEVCSIEDKRVKELIVQADFIVFGYPIYYSNIPLIVRDFIISNHKLWYRKDIFIIATMGLFSGDGSGCLSRLLKTYGSNIIGGLHVKMPDCIIDVKVLKKTKEEEKVLITKAVSKINHSAQCHLENRPTQQGLSILSRFLGFMGQRAWFYRMTKTYKDYPKINREVCNACGACIKVCPMHNLKMGTDNKVHHLNTCTLCYRCVHTCPKQALAILGEKVVAQPFHKS